MMETTLSTNALNAAKTTRIGGRQYFVVPAASIVPGVLPGSRGPLYYPDTEVSRNVEAWNEIPVTLYHPYDPVTNAPLSASDPGVAERQHIGVVRQSLYNGKLRHKLYIDADRTRALNRDLYDRLKRGDRVELSTGLFTDNEPTPGMHNGRHYDCVARNYRPDHIAILPDQRGACSLDDGCGAHVTNADPPPGGS